MALPIHSLRGPDSGDEEPKLVPPDDTPEFPEKPAPTHLSVQASRATKGNFWFPPRLVLDGRGITYTKPKLFGSKTVTLAYDKIGTVALETGLFYAKLVIEADTDHDISVSGLRKRDARAVKAFIEAQQG
jgi:hypothetical protein